MDKFIKILRIILLLFFLLWAISWSSIRAYKSVNEGHSGEVYNKFLVELHNTPYNIRKWYREKDKVKKPNLSFVIDTVKDVKEIGKGIHLNSLSDSIYLLHSSNINKSTVQILLQNIKTGEVAQKWTINLNEIMPDLDSIRALLVKSNIDGDAVKNLDFHVPKKTEDIIIRHSLMLNDGSLLFKVAYPGYIYKMDRNSKILWKIKKLAHHSIEQDENGNIWTCAYDLNNETANKLEYKEDAILCFDQDGNELYFKSLTDIFLENNLFSKIIESTPVGYDWLEVYKDPYHLNDVKPLKKDGSFWKKGDVFLSIRNKSLVALFRPKTGKIIMQMQGPWLNQHDVDIENDSILSIFNNNLSFLNDQVKNYSNIALYNFKNDRTDFVFNGIFNSKFQGRKTRLHTKDVLIEETMTGLYYLLDSIGNLKYKFYVPYPPNPNFAQYPGWSRVYLKDNGQFIEE